MNGSKRRIKPEQDDFIILWEIKQSEEITMDNLIEVISFVKIEHLLDKSVSIEHKYEDNSYWFKITGYGQEKEDDGRIFITGYDAERLNRKIFLKDIETIVI